MRSFNAGTRVHPPTSSIISISSTFNLHGILNVEQGYYVEDVEVEEPIPEEKDAEKKDPDVSLNSPPSLLPVQPSCEDERATKRPRLSNQILTNPQAMDTDNAEKPKTRKVKKQVRKGDLPIVSGTSSLDEASKVAAAEQESAMIMEDKLVADTEEKKNELETYIYEMRNKIDDQYAEFASEDEKTKLKAKLEASEVSSKHP